MKEYVAPSMFIVLAEKTDVLTASAQNFTVEWLDEINLD